MKVRLKFKFIVFFFNNWFAEKIFNFTVLVTRKTDSFHPHKKSVFVLQFARKKYKVNARKYWNRIMT